ncbi:MAG: FIST C-terminal domain-containing protein [Fibrobacter sp.]|jgi:hypothetical protein|nr:FIST C-terminal domain-containing protein [Fibrobacter sp.]
MIKILTAFTDEVDDVEIAVNDIKSKLGPLLKNSVGLITCYADFIDSGIYQGVCAALPFEVIGTTTIASKTDTSHGDILLTLTVFTSDSVSFSVGLSDALTEEDPAVLEKAYAEALAKLPGKPALMLSCAPLLMNISGDFYANALSAITGGVPNFGSLAVDHYDDYHHAEVLYRGESYRDRYAFVLFAGDIHPKFFIANISPEKVFREKGLVSASSGNQLQAVNNEPVVKYLMSLGLEKNEDGSISGVNSFPFIIDMNDGTEPVVRATFAVTPDGSAVCGGNIPVGSIISVGTLDGDAVIDTAGKRLQEVLASGNFSGMLMFSCVGRYLALGYEYATEMEKIHSILAPSGIPYTIAYSGGELCPVYSTVSGSITNKNHNDTLIICAF